MIPRKLELKNFLCYGEQVQTINFEQYSLICLSGKNGNGKSALLDAMTWALWGQARKITGTAKADEGLVRLGQTRMMVSFEFQMGKEIYRTRREFAKAYGKPYAALDFEIFDTTDAKFVSLTDKTIKITQEKIEKTLGLDFETFINSAFLKQGQSNEFSKKTPKERKQILTTILGLSRYDKLQQLALDEVKKYTEEKRLLEKLLEQDHLFLEKEAATQTLFSQEKQTLETLSKQLEQLHQDYAQTEQRKKTLLDTQQQLLLITQEVSTLEQKKALKQATLRNLYTNWKQTHAQSLLLPNVKKLEKEKWELIQKEKDFLTQHQKALELQEEILKKRELIQKHTTQIKQQHEATLYQFRLDLEKKLLGLEHLAVQNKQLKKEMLTLTQQEKEVLDELSDIKKVLTQEMTFRTEYEQIKAHFEKRRTFYQTLVQQGNQMKKELHDLHQKKEVVEDQTSPACPLCQQILTVKRKQFLTSQFGKQEKYLLHRLNRITQLVKKLKELLVAQHEHLQKLSTQADMYTQLHQKEDGCTKRIDQLKKQHEALEKQYALTTQQQEDEKKLNQELAQQLTKQAALLQTSLEQDPQLQEFTTTIIKLEQEKNKFSFHSDDYNQLQTELKKIEQTLQSLITLPDALEKQRENRHSIVILCKELKESHATLDMLNQKRQHFTFNPDELKQEEMRMHNFKQEMTSLLEKKEKALTLLGSLENEIQRFQTTHEERRKKIVTLKKIEEESGHYQILAHTFSKNGIQALLIEEAIPEIEEEANIILSKLTNNQAHIFIESLRDLKSGGVKETLDIKITDSAGMRAYELFSGGEAFRIDFALRIAISKLLARRAGTSLQTLIIDEGFGSQDEEGLAHLMNAIHTIHHDFSKVIIVSHLAEFKDNFPIHFIVEKEPTGSVIKIEERG